MSLSTVWLWLAMLQRELLLFAATCLAVGACHVRRMDRLLAWLRINGRACALHLASGFAATPDWPACVDRAAGGQPGAAAVLVPVWSEAPVVAAVIEHCLAAWPNADLRLYVGCHRNDPATLAAVMRCATDPRLRIVVHDRDGPTTKADCLNRLYLALQADELRSGRIVRSVIVYDAAKPRDDDQGRPPLPALWA